MDSGHQPTIYMLVQSKHLNSNSNQWGHSTQSDRGYWMVTMQTSQYPCVDIFNDIRPQPLSFIVLIGRLTSADIKHLRSQINIIFQTTQRRCWSINTSEDFRWNSLKHHIGYCSSVTWPYILLSVFHMNMESIMEKGSPLIRIVDNIIYGTARVIIWDCVIKMNLCIDFPLPSPL